MSVFFSRNSKLLAKMFKICTILHFKNSQNVFHSIIATRGLLHALSVLVKRISNLIFFTASIITSSTSVICIRPINNVRLFLFSINYFNNSGNLVTSRRNEFFSLLLLEHLIIEQCRG